MSRIFLDYNATSPPSKEVLDFLKTFSSWGNASSIHSSGRRARSLLLKTRRGMASYFDVEPGELLFTSGGSEANNMVIKGLLSKLKERGQDTLITSSVEHPSVAKTMTQMESWGFKVVRTPVTLEKGLDYDFVAKALSENKVGLVSIMQANNETGEVFDLKRIRGLIDKAQGENKIYFHSDMVQALGKIETDLKPVDFASFSAHKFYALQGTGLLYQKKGMGLEPFLVGGGQEKGRRAGTENLLGIGALGVQLARLSGLSKKKKEIESLRDFMEQRILEKIEGVQVLAQKRKRLPNTSQLLIDGVHGETMLINLDLKGFEVSTGAACSSGNPEPSPVLIAMGLTNQEASKSLRVSLGWETSKEEVENFIGALSETVEKIRAL